MYWYFKYSMEFRVTQLLETLSNKITVIENILIKELVCPTVDSDSVACQFMFLMCFGNCFVVCYPQSPEPVSLFQNILFKWNSIWIYLEVEELLLWMLVLIVTVCDQKCISDCSTKGAGKCDSQCAATYSLYTGSGDSSYTCVRTYLFSLIIYLIFIFIILFLLQK